jgi:uncharacterized membrane protein
MFLNSSPHLPRKELLWLLISLLVLGVFLRFVHLDRKVYWHDEVYTSLRINGYNGEQVVEQLFDGQVIRVDDLLKFQRPSPTKSFQDTLNVLVEHPEHPPLYYIFAHFWVKLFGGSVAATRSLSAAISLFVFPALYWLCWELFKNPRVGWYAIALMAVSPFHILYAQEARQYSLWTLVTLLASASLLRAMRRSTWLNWGLYSLALALNFYTFLLSSLVAFCYTLYILAIEKFRWTKTLKRFLLSSFLGVLLFLPWLWVIRINYANFHDKTSWTKVKEPLTFLATLWGLHLNSTFVDLGFELYSLFNYMITAALVLLVSCAIYLLYRQTSLKIWLFLVLLITIPYLGLILPDLMFGGRASSMSRYFIPFYLGIQIVIAYLLAQLQFSRYKLFSVLLVTLISVGILSCGISSQQYRWWNKALNYHNPEIAAIINQSKNPLVISNDFNINVGNILSLSHALDPQTKLVLVKRENVPEIPVGFSDIFMFNPSPDLISRLENTQNFKPELIYELSFQLWKLQPIG